MSLALVHARALDGIEAPPVTVEVHLGNGLPQFHLVGLADTEVREARDRVRAAIQSAQFEFPQRRITVNLAPADLPKEGGRFDLAIAIGILAASGQVAERLLPRLELCGELSLNGGLRPVRGSLSGSSRTNRNSGRIEKRRGDLYEPVPAFCYLTKLNIILIFPANPGDGRRVLFI